MNIRRLLAVWSAKFIGFACRLTGKQGVTLAGQIALKLDPKILTELATCSALPLRQKRKK